MMTKNVYNLLRILLKQKSKSQVKKQKSKLLLYDIYLKKYVSADELLVPRPPKDSIEGLDSWKKSKDFMLFDLLLKKFINPKLDLLSPPGANIKSKIWHCNAVQGCRYVSTLKDFWERGSENNKSQVPALPSTSKVGSKHVVGWAGQVISKPESNPRPEHSTSPTTEPSGIPDNNSRTPRSTPGKGKSKKYDKNSSRNGALLYEGKSERKKKSILAKSLKPQNNVTLQTKSKNKLWAKKYNIFNKSINALTKPKSENSINTLKKEELLRVQPPKREKETLFNKIYSQMFSFRKTGGTDREENLNKRSNLQKKDNISKDAQTPSQSNNSHNQKSVVNNTSDSKLAEIVKEYQKVSQNEKGSKNERSVVENNTSENKLSKNVKEYHKVTQIVTSSQDEKPDVKNKTSESKMETNLKQQNKVTSNLTRTKTGTSDDKNNTLEKKLAIHVKEHRNVTQSLKSSQNKKPSEKNKMLESTLAKNINEHHKVIQKFSNSENEKTGGISKSNLVKSIKDHHKDTQNSSSSKSEILDVKTSEGKLENSIKEHKPVAQSVKISQNEKPDVKNKISGSTMANNVIEHHKSTCKKSSKSETFSIKNNSSGGKMAKSVEEHHKFTQNSSNSANKKITGISKSNLVKSVKDHQQVAQNSSSYKSEILDVKTSKGQLANSVKEHHKVTQNLTSSENEKPDVKNKISECTMAKNLMEHHKVTHNLTSSKSETFAVKNNTSEGKMAKSVKEHHQDIQNLSNSENETTGGISKTSLGKSVKDHHKVTQNSLSSKGEILEVKTSEGKLENSIKEHKPVTQSVKISQNEKPDIKNKISESTMAKNVIEHHKSTCKKNSKSETFSIKNNTSEGKKAKSVEEHHKVTRNLSNSENEITGVFSKSNLAKSVKDHQQVEQNSSSYKSEILDVTTSKGKLANSVHNEVTQNLTSSENEKTGAHNKTSGIKLADNVKESDKVTHDLTISQNTEVTNKSANDADRNANRIETKISEVIQDTTANFKNESSLQKLKKENLNVIETSENDLRHISSNSKNKSDIKIKNDKVDSEQIDIKIGSNNENKPNSKEKANTLANNTSQLKNNSGGKYLANQNEKTSQEKYQPAKLKSLENILFNFLCPPTLLKYKQTISTSENKINQGEKYENYTLDQVLVKMTKIKQANNNKVSSLITNSEATQRVNLPNVNISEKSNPSANPVKQLKNQSSASSLGTFNKPIISNLNSSKVQNKTQNKTPQTLPKSNIGNTVLSGFENTENSKAAEDSKASYLSQKKILTQVEDDINEVNTIKSHNIEPESTEKLHAISAQGKYLEDLALDGELNQYNIANYKGFKIVNSNSGTQVTKKNIPEQSKLKEVVGRNINQSKRVDKTSEKPTDLQQSTELKNSALHESKKQVTNENFPQQATPLGRRSSQPKYTIKSLGKPTTLKKSTELKNSALDEYKKQVKNNKVILQNKTLLDETNKDVNSIRRILEAKNIKDQETVKNNILSNKNMVVENTKVTKEVNKHLLPNKNAMVECVVKTKNIVELNKPHISRPTSKANKRDKNTEESPIPLPSVKKRNNYINGNKFDSRVRLRRKLMKPIMFKYSIKKSRKLKNPPQQEETKHFDHRKKKESISLKLPSEHLKKQAKSGKKTKYLSKTSQLVNKTQLNNQQRSKSVPIFPEKKTVSIRKQGNEKHIIQSKSLETLLPSKKVSSEKQTKSLRQGTQVKISKIKGPLSDVKYSSKNKSKLTNTDLNSQIKKQSFQSLERINFKAQGDVRKGKITTKRSLPNINPSNFNKTPNISTSQKGLDSLKINKSSTIHSQLSHVSKRTVAPKVSKMIVGTNSSPELSNQIEEYKNRKGKQFDAKTAKKLSTSKPSHGSKAALNLEQQNNREKSTSGRTPKVSRSKSESESSPVSLDALKHEDKVYDRRREQTIPLNSKIILNGKEPLKPKSQTNDTENYSLINKANNEGSMNVTKREVITPKNCKDDLNSKNSSHSLKLVKSNQQMNLNENHTNENKSREDDKVNKPTIKTKQSIINLRRKNVFYNKKNEIQKNVSLRKVVSNEIKDMNISKEKKNSNNLNEVESFSVKESPKNETKPGKQETKTGRTKTVVSIKQKVPKPTASKSGSKYQNRSKLNNMNLTDTSREHKSKILTKGKNGKVNLNSKESLSSFILPNIKHDVAKKSKAMERYLKEHVKSQEINKKRENKAQEEDDISNINFIQLNRARFKSEKLSDKLEDEKIVNLKYSKNYKINKYKQQIVEAKESEQINTNMHDTSQQKYTKDIVNKTERPSKEQEIDVFHRSKVSNNKEQLSKNVNITTMLHSTQHDVNIPKTPNKQQPSHEGNKTKTQIAGKKQIVNNPRTSTKEPVSERKTKKLLNSTKQSGNTIKTTNNNQNNKEKAEELLNITKQIRNITKEAKPEPSSGRNAPKELNNMTQTSNPPKAVNKNLDITLNKTLTSQKVNKTTENYSHSRNEDANESSFMKHDSMGKKLNIENKGSEVKNKKSPDTTSESKMVTSIKIYNKDKSQQKLGMENSELKNNVISRNKMNIKENSNNKFKTKTEPLNKLTSKRLPHTSKGNDEGSLKNKQPLMQDSKIPTNVLESNNNETHFTSGIKSKFISISITESHTNKEVISNNLKEEENTKKYIGNNDMNPLSSLHNEIKHNVTVSSPNKNITKTDSKGKDSAITRKQGENSNVNKQSLIKDKVLDVSPGIRRELSLEKLNIQETKLSSPKSDHTLERQNSPSDDRKTEEKSSKEQKMKQQGIKGKQEQFLQHLAGFKNDNTRNGIAMDNTNNEVKTEKTEHNISLGTKKTVCETKEDLSEFNKSHFKTKDHTHEKLRLILGDNKTGSKQKFMNDNKEPIKQFSQIGKEGNKVITLDKVQNGNKKEVKKPEPTALNLKDKIINANEQPKSANKSEEDSRLIKLSKKFSSLKTKELNGDLIKLDKNDHLGPSGQNATEEDVLKNDSSVQAIKNTDSIQIKINKKINSSAQNDLLNLMDKNKMKPIVRNEKADIKSINKDKNLEGTSTKCDTSQATSDQSLKAPIVEDTNTPKKKEITSLVSFKNDKTSE